MSDMKNEPQDSGKTGSSTQPGSVAGKGWDILVGGKENPYAAGGSDPFDLNTVAQPKDMSAHDAETDAILKLGAQGSSAPGQGAATGSGLGPIEVPSQAIPVPGSGLSAGVSVTPVMPGTAPASGITEVAKPEETPASGQIIEVSPSTPPAAPAPTLTPLPSLPLATLPPATPVLPGTGPLGQLGSLVTPQARSLPGAAPAAPIQIPFPSWGAASGKQSLGSDIDPFSTQVDVVVKTKEIDLPPDDALKTLLVTKDRINALWDEINQTYDLVVNDVRGHFNTTEEAIVELRNARELLLSGAQNYDNAEQLLMDVKARLRLEEKVRQWAKSRGSWLAAYLIIWLLLLSAASLFTKVFQTLAVKFIPDWMVGTWLPALFGALGGVIGALWVLNRHITRKRDFDPEHTMWYATNPFLGGALGVMTYILVRGGGWLLTSVGGGSSFELTGAAEMMLNALCLVVGFNQNVLWSLLDRFIKAVVPEKEGESTAATDLSASTVQSSNSGGSDGGSDTTSASGGG